jgi:AraC-like DNA-binding protein
MQETTAFWRHPSFPDLGLLAARFTRHRYDLHTHPTYVIALITEGAERVRVDGRPVVAPAGSVLVVNPEELHDGEAAAEGGWAYRTFYPSVPLMSAVARDLGRCGPPLFARRLIEDAPLARALGDAHRRAQEEDAMSAEISMLVALRGLVLGHGDGPAPEEPIAPSGSRRRLTRYEEVIESDLAAEIDLARLAEAAGVTRFQVIRDFKKAAGLTPAAFIRNRRLRQAGWLIEQGASLADAASAAGFADQSHLSRAFRAVHGITPGMFRKAGFGRIWSP